MMKWLDATLAGKKPDIDRVELSYLLMGQARQGQGATPAKDPSQVKEWFYVGPHVMMVLPDSARTRSGGSIRISPIEDFGAGKTARVVDNHPFKIRLVRSGATLEVPAHASVLEVLRANGYEIPSSCETGTCGTCKVRLINGEPDHRDLVLTKYWRASRSHSSELELDL
jgi:ferredoxin